MSKTSKYIIQSVLAALAVLVLIQAIPYGRTYTNPPVIREPSWDSPATRALAKRACFDCHSFETVWPWYSRIAPISWLVRFDVDEGRGELNFSDWQNGAREGERPDKLGREISKGKMPPFVYLPTHPEARLSDSEKRQLIDGLNATALRR
jgi:hypothetical protein